jgi:hypothetical protein
MALRSTSAWPRRIALGLGLWLAYMANGREVGAGDTIPAILQPIGVARGDGLRLDRFEPAMRRRDPSSFEPGRFPPYYLAVRQGRLVSRFPAMTVLVGLPLVLPQVAYLDLRRPGWDASPESLVWYARRMAKTANAAMVAVTGVVLFELLVALGLAAVAWPATLVAMLGSPMLSVASQSAWHHAPAAFLFVIALRLLAGARRPVPVVVAGCALAATVACRVPMIVFATPLVAWVAWRSPRDAPRLLAPLAVGAVGLLAYNLAVFDALAGGQAELEAIRLPMHQVSGSWGDPLEGLAGTLVSPSRGLLLFCPWVLAAALALPAARTRLAATPLAIVLAAGLAGWLVVFAGYSAWWAGWCFGPRYWTEAVPVLAIFYAFALDATRSRAARSSLYATGVLAIAIHAVGAFHYPSTWNGAPANVDTHHERLWDWRDSELSRELTEGPHPREFSVARW